MLKRTLILSLWTGTIAGAAVLCLWGEALAHQTATQTGKDTKPSSAPAAPTQAKPNLPVARAAANADPDRATLEINHPSSDETTGIYRGRDFVFSQEDMVITGSEAKDNRKTDILDAEGNIVMDDTKHHMTSDKVHMDHVERGRKLRLVTFTDHVVLVMKPETDADAAGASPPPTGGTKAPAGSPPNGNPLPVETKQAPDEDREKANQQKRHGGTATCDHLDYKYAAKYSILTGHVVFTQRFKDKDGKEVERTLTCEHAEYDSKADKLHLFKPVHYEDNQDQDLKTNDDVFVGTKEGAETTDFVGKVIFVFPAQQDEDDNGDTQNAKASSTSKKQPDKNTKPPK